MHITVNHFRWLLFGITALIPVVAFSQTAVDAPFSRLVVTVCEYRADLAVSATTSPREIVTQLLEGDTKPVRTIRLPTVSDCEAHFSDSERIHVRQPSSDGESERVAPHTIEVGTILQLTAQRTPDAVSVQFNYSTTRVANEHVANSYRGVKESTVQNTYSFQLGEPVLVGGVTGKDGFYLVATVTDPTPARLAKD